MFPKKIFWVTSNSLFVICPQNLLKLHKNMLQKFVIFTEHPNHRQTNLNEKGATRRIFFDSIKSSFLI